MPSETTFLDSSGWIAPLNRRDKNHAKAVTISQGLDNRKALIVITDWIIAETGNGLASSPIRRGFAQAARYLIGSNRYRIVEIDGGLLDRSLALYASRLDKTWGTGRLLQLPRYERPGDH